MKKLWINERKGKKWVKSGEKSSPQVFCVGIPPAVLDGPTPALTARWQFG